MFNLSGTEIVVILLLALVVLGPEKLPDAIRRFGRTYAELKKMGTGFQQEFKSAIDEPLREMRETADLLKKSVDFSMTTTEADVSSETTAAPDTVTDRPTRNDGIAPADPDLEPTTDVPFADDDTPTVEGPSVDDDTVDYDTIDADTPTVDGPFVDDDTIADGIDDDDADVLEGSHDGRVDRGEADDA